MLRVPDPRTVVPRECSIPWRAEEGCRFKSRNGWRQLPTTKQFLRDLSRCVGSTYVLDAGHRFSVRHGRFDQLSNQITTDPIELDAVFMLGGLSTWLAEVKHHGTSCELQGVRPLIKASQEVVRLFGCFWQDHAVALGSI